MLERTYNTVYALSIFAAYYYILKLPLQGWPILHHDDAEALYHTLALIQGRIPHLQDATHHSFGYVLPYYLLSYVFGFSEFLLRQSANVIQPLTALAVYLTVRCYQRRPLALLCGLLYLSAREPWVNAFYPQYLMNAVLAWTLFFTTRWVQTNADRFFYFSCLSAGLGIVIDQRLLFLALIPATSFFLGTSLKFSLKRLITAGAVWLLPILCWILYLYSHGALEAYIEQAYLYPLLKRSASISLLEHLRIALNLHINAVELSPIHFVCGAVGFFFLLTKAKEKSSDCLKLVLIYTSAVISILAITYFGGRTYDYYTIIWFPILAGLAGHSFGLFLSRLGRRAFFLILMFLALNSLANAYLIRNYFTEIGYTGDGALAVSRSLQGRLKQEDSLVVWHSRFEPYVYLQKLAPTEYASVIFFQPDGKIRDQEARKKHADTSLQERFISKTNTSPPDWILKFEHKFLGKASAANDFVLNLIESKYQLEETVVGIDILGDENVWKVYRLNLTR